MDSLKVAAKVVRKHWMVFLRWTLAIVGLVLGIIALFTDHGWWAIVSWPVSFALLVWSMVTFGKDWTALVETRLSRPIWEYTDTYRAWAPLGEGRTHAIYSDVLNLRLAAGDPIGVERGSNWLPKGRAAELHERAALRLATNDPKLRLATDLLETSTRVTLDMTDYASFVATNRLAYAAWWDRAKEEMYLSFEDLEPLTQVARTLPDLAESRASNHLGGDILAVGPGVVFLQLQNSKNGMYPDMWVASGSGSFDLSDWTPGRDLQHLVKNGLLRELSEEMKLRSGDVPTHADTKIIGYSRATYMAGKPQFYGICRIGEVKPGTDKYARRYEKLTFSGGADGLVKALHDFVARNEDRVAPPLEMLVRVTELWLRSDPDNGRWLLTRPASSTAPARP